MTPSDTSLEAQCYLLARRAREAASALATASPAAKDRWLLRAADALLAKQSEILAANEQDLAAADAHGLSPAQIDRLRLTPDRLTSAAAGLREVAALPDPVGQVRGGGTRPNGLQVVKV